MFSNRTSNRFIVGQQQKTQAYDIASTFTGIESFNLNAHYLKEIGFLMEEWRLLNLYGIQGSTLSPGYFDRAIKILDALLDLLSAKISRQEIVSYNKWIRNCEVKAGKLFENRQTGLWVNKQSLPQVNYAFRFVYRFLLSKMEEKGMLTQKQSDPNLAMGDMS